MVGFDLKKKMLKSKELCSKEKENRKTDRAVVTVWVNISSAAEYKAATQFLNENNVREHKYRIVISSIVTCVQKKIAHCYNQILTHSEGGNGEIYLFFVLFTLLHNIKVA